MANTGGIFCLPDNDLSGLPYVTITQMAQYGGVMVSSIASAWGFGEYVVLSESVTQDIAIIGLQFQITNVPSVDATNEQLFEIAVGPLGKEVTKLQFPYHNRSDTAVGYYHNHTNKLMLPEGFIVRKLSRISVRVANSLATAITYNGVRILYQGTGKTLRLVPFTNNYQYAKVGGDLTGSDGNRVR